MKLGHVFLPGCTTESGYVVPPRTITTVLRALVSNDRMWHRRRRLMILAVHRAYKETRFQKLGGALKRAAE